MSKGGRLISDILEITDSLQIDGLLMTIDIEKAFNSINNFFLISVLKQYSFGDDFIKWINTLPKNHQQLCALNCRKTIHYFKLERGSQQGDPISAYLFILVLEIAFTLIKTNNVEDLNIFNHNFLYTAYADIQLLLQKI